MRRGRCHLPVVTPSRRAVTLTLCLCFVAYSEPCLAALHQAPHVLRGRQGAYISPSVQDPLLDEVAASQVLADRQAEFREEADAGGLIAREAAPPARTMPPFVEVSIEAHAPPYFMEGGVLQTRTWWFGKSVTGQGPQVAAQSDVRLRYFEGRATLEIAHTFGEQFVQRAGLDPRYAGASFERTIEFDVSGLEAVLGSLWEDVNEFQFQTSEELREEIESRWRAGGVTSFVIHDIQTLRLADGTTVEGRGGNGPDDRGSGFIDCVKDRCIPNATDDQLDCLLIAAVVCTCICLLPWTSALCSSCIGQALKTCIGVGAGTFLLCVVDCAQDHFGPSGAGNGGDRSRTRPQAVRASMPLKNAGVYNVATGTWRRHGTTANLGPDIIYRSDAPSGYFGTGWENSVGVDEGILPGTQNANQPGPLDSYCINGFQFGYCSTSLTPINWAFLFFDSYVPCDDPDDFAGACTNTVASVCMTGLPSGSFCWLITVDLEGGAEFAMAADGGPCAPGYHGAASGLDHFGVASMWAGTTGTGALSGPLLWGHDPSWVPSGEGTCYSPGFTNPCSGLFASGLGSQDLFAVGNPVNGCFFFGGYKNTNGCGGPAQNPGAQFAMILFTDCFGSSNCDEDDCFTVYCDPGPAATPNLTNLSVDNCDCSDGRGIFTIDDTDGNFAGNQFGYMLQSMTQASIQNPPGAGGTLCVAGGTLCRYNKDFFILPGGGSVQSNLNGPNNTACTNPCALSGQTWNWQAWHRDGMNPSRFSHAITITYN